jgi:hypothetical protein
MLNLLPNRYIPAHRCIGCAHIAQPALNVGGFVHSVNGARMHLKLIAAQSGDKTIKELV